MSNEILHKQIVEKFNSIFSSPPPEVPDYVADNLGHKLRPYQEHALSQFIFTQEIDQADLYSNHLLFHMATGSGKTLVLASNILYLYKEQNKQNFIFFVNSDAIIKKTKDNLTNTNSLKYLFRKEGIVIDGNQIDIQIVDVFPSLPDPHTVYLKLTTIQKLHLDLTEPRENSLTFEGLEELEIVLLADEAHHINAWTRRDKRKLNTKEQEERTWENTVNRLLKLNPANRLLEYTATIDLTKDVLFEKYRDKIVCQYDLRQFMRDGYSKNVMLLRADEEDRNKMLNSVLLSQYRKYVARDHGIDLKPIIFFKSNLIKNSQNAQEKFINLIKGLEAEELKEVIENGYTIYKHQQSIWSSMFAYYKKIDLNQVVQDLKWDFAEGNLLNANDRDFLSEENALILNSLEEANNPIRVIFAVARLNEGWDVLNLFDIVRISEGATKTKATTDSEAQLIGRGARYYPFEYKDEDSYTRRFDFGGENSELRVIESLHYHTINDNAYIKNLEKSLKSANIQVKEDKYHHLEAKIKPSFKKNPIFKEGNIYINKLIETTAEDYNTLEKYNVSTVFDIPFEMAIEQKYGSKITHKVATQTHEVSWKVEEKYIQKAIQRRPFFHYSNLKNYMPSISSMKTFIESKDFLGDLTLYVSLPSETEIKDLDPITKLEMVEKFFESMEKKIRLNYMKNRGTPVFEGVKFSKLINDYQIELNKVNQGISDIDELVQPRNMRDHDWFIYDKAIVNSLENSFINFINDYIKQLKEKYKEVYLIRNERKVKIVEIDGTRGFMPDFLLYLQDESCTYQIFLEPKGDHLRVQDKWKEDFLTSLGERNDVEVLTENEEVRLLGIKFYSETPELKERFRKDFIEKTIKE
ncbi:TPA: DEAD/DEAH box helicase family protein [Listeria monocytogenes]|nr:DEAD/DEAH box helicase family protein [Listeria monocytogenes]HAZ4396985.1 DEAD/DEAH box helicase family protein [Listeria monocytogenes]HAZ4465809.1 DEAD/DEAH box helicase family protein [Listeria monocytogenes]HAZ4468868.1 DEAD/DEAH box helicase family protein [Listeria monocytogenes]HAZ4487394.1 DEAD/DEAH box helicase family protein [Listeria monocytogenes]